MYRAIVCLPKILEDKVKEENKKTGVPISEIIRRSLYVKFDIKEFPHIVQGQRSDIKK